MPPEPLQRVHSHGPQTEGLAPPREEEGFAARGAGGDGKGRLARMRLPPFQVSKGPLGDERAPTRTWDE